MGVESVVARCLLDADFLQRARSDPAGTLAAYELDERARADFHALDFTRVGNFAGFITKVQHNYLWESMPYTRALLKHYAIEIEVFAAYHETHLALRKRGATRREKIGAFLEFLDAYITSGYPGLRDVLRHERLQWEIESSQPSAAVTAPRPASGLPGELVPRIRGSLRVGWFELSPLEIVAQMSAGRFDPGQLSLDPGPLVYWVDPAAEQLRIMRADSLTAALLSGIDGHSPVGAIVSRVAGRRADAAALARVQPVLDHAVQLGLLTLVAKDGEN
jgi:hypothetical protein